jgi:hypothetical protein
LVVSNRSRKENGNGCGKKKASRAPGQFAFFIRLRVVPQWLLGGGSTEVQKRGEEEEKVRVKGKEKIYCLGESLLYRIPLSQAILMPVDKGQHLQRTMP